MEAIIDYGEFGLRKATNSQISFKSQMSQLYDQWMDLFFERLSHKETNKVLVTIRKYNGVPETMEAGEYKYQKMVDKEMNQCCDINFTIKQPDLDAMSKLGNHIIEISIYDTISDEYLFYHSETIDFVEETSNMRYPFHLLVEEEYV